MTSSNDPNAAMQAFFQAGQTFAQGMAQFMGGQQKNWPAQLAALAPAAGTGQQQENAALAALQQEWQQQHAALWQAMLRRNKNEAAEPLVKAEPGDRRFDHPAWAESPIYDYVRQAYLLNAGYLKKMAEAAPLTDSLAKSRLQFMTRQITDALAPSNFAATNPEFVKKALETNGESIKLGLQNLLGDLEKGRISMTDDSAFEVGRNLATTPGAVVFENEVFQLLQYSPLTDTVAQRPLLIVPPCINKYYILDLQPENSFVRYAVAQGQTVFLVSWRNPQVAQGHLTWDDYLEHGALTALKVVREICAIEQINALGFCVGGTILSAALAVAKARGENPVAALTLLTTLLDFSDTGEIGCYVDEQSVANREATIGQGGLLTGKDLSTTFSSLRANDLIWQYVVGNYLKGNQPTAFDLLYWNSDSTNLPGPFAAWYLRNLYLENNLRVPGKLSMCGVRADLGQLDMPAFILATREDHIVPWQSSYLSRKLLSGAVTFVLGASGHIAGVINPAAKNKRSHWVNDSATADPQEWLDTSTEVKGSWWPRWTDWLQQHAAGTVPARGRLGSAQFPPGQPAPGHYVKQKA
ncbi:MAG: class I poly(R)-hydroxyalkanoic acid synthase [Gammaproteobacteria bacterium]|nr:class I poly(R)-hydroxyalkanoic acid synthase [Rhodocyclaceae bacterium]MBU3909575.1 class I poly(R)-hydroxyalkanoic acid synthase [Gammaproteobacteria bacterium]MBU4003238.1 class I poly(R)-hydroxyalkanoic acid synthase [Gammaproteobacteria bacterium]MBU4022287.1 class I poly(R)-hydroxyalkanoic acid synthase [Gammaproteobacteria bacterium]MBU4097594.1 class I poly(R)-hydroxyalkanoic acid synthase [Gammaproteobacteria bacterium]